MLIARRCRPADLSIGLHEAAFRAETRSRSAVEHKGHRPIVQQFNLHVRRKDPGFNGNALLSQICRNLFVESFGFIRGRRLVKAWRRPFAVLPSNVNWDTSKTDPPMS